jgi:hypothetical protein
MLYIKYAVEDQQYSEEYIRTPFIRINWEAQPSGYAENPDDRNFLRK